MCPGVQHGDVALGSPPQGPSLTGLPQYTQLMSQPHSAPLGSLSTPVVVTAGQAVKNDPRISFSTLAAIAGFQAGQSSQLKPVGVAGELGVVHPASSGSLNVSGSACLGVSQPVSPCITPPPPSLMPVVSTNINPELTIPQCGVITHLGLNALTVGSAPCTGGLHVSHPSIGMTRTTSMSHYINRAVLKRRGSVPAMHILPTGSTATAAGLQYHSARTRSYTYNPAATTGGLAAAGTLGSVPLLPQGGVPQPSTVTDPSCLQPAVLNSNQQYVLAAATQPGNASSTSVTLQPHVVAALSRQQLSPYSSLHSHHSHPHSPYSSIGSMGAPPGPGPVHAQQHRETQQKVSCAICYVSLRLALPSLVRLVLLSTLFECASFITCINSTLTY